jgi:hypothetical protein
MNNNIPLNFPIISSHPPIILNGSAEEALYPKSLLVPKPNIFGCDKCASKVLAIQYQPKIFTYPYPSPLISIIHSNEPA